MMSELQTTFIIEYYIHVIRRFIFENQDILDEIEIFSLVRSFKEDFMVIIGTSIS